MLKTKDIILRVALPTTLHRQFDYFAPQDIDIKVLKPGVRVSVPFQSRTLVGILMDLPASSPVPYQKLKHAHAILDAEPILPDDVRELCQWAADYYQTPIGDVFNYALPTLLRKGKEAKEKNSPTNVPAILSQQSLVLNTAQQNAIDAIIEAHDRFQAFLLDGVTGSGKTEIYLRTIQHFLNQNKQVLVLVPEISLTPQTISRFQARFPVRIASMHSNLTERERLNVWLGAKEGTIRIVIGTRSAIFTPFCDLGFIIIDEEHDASFKQQDRFRYHARDLSIVRANLKHIPIVLGSATPSLASLLNAKRGRYQVLNLPQRAGIATMPIYKVIDINKIKLKEGISDAVIAEMRAHLQAGNQVMLFLNRRGFAPVLYCLQCNWVATCKRCDSKLVYHQHPSRLHCHLCDAKLAVPERCQSCQSSELEPIGIGTQRLEEVIKNIFPDVPLIRIDRDSTKRKGAMQELLTEINQTDKAILLGTQMLAKGHHFPNVTLVGIIDADSGFFSADFRAAEHMGQLLVQVAGRAGREHKQGIVLIQTRNPNHPLLQQLLHAGYPQFAETLLAEREASLLPPFAHFAICRAESFQENAAENFLIFLKEIGVVLDQRVAILGPVPAIIAKRKGYHCKHLIFRCNDRRVLQHYLKSILIKLENSTTKKFPVKWIIDVDPMEI